MVERFRDHLEERDLSPEILEQLDERLEDNDYDMEYLVDELDLLAEAEEVQEKWGGDSGNGMSEEVSVVRAEAEWFIQHICERVQLRFATTLWRPVLRHRTDHNFVLATTNYDRAIELAASQQSIDIHDGFPSFGEDEWVSWEGFEDTNEVKLLKLHGSTDWYLSEEDDTVWKLRHPMPLFGRITLRVKDHDRVDLQNAAVLPSREKKIRRPPYPELSTEIQRQAPNADIAVFIGSSLRDPNIRSVYHSCIDECATFLVNISGEYPSQVQTDKAQIIQQSASRFLISTLPTALNHDAGEVIEYLESQTDNPCTDEILQEVITATQTSAPRQDRLEAIDELAALQVSLEKDEILPLLKSNSQDVKKYALGLLQESTDRDNLIKTAEEIANQNPDSEFAVEFELLQELMKA